MKKQLNWLSVIVFGLILLASPMVNAEEEDWSAEEVRSAWELANEDRDEVEDLLEGDMPEALGDLTKDLVYTPVVPCKIADTRVAGPGIIFAGTARFFRVYGTAAQMFAQGAPFIACPAPRGEPRAALINLVSANQSGGKGTLRASPIGASQGLTVNFNSAVPNNLSNAGTVQTTFGGGADIEVRSFFANSHAVINVLGYFYPASPVFIDEDFETGPGGNPTNTTQFLADPAQVTVTRSGQKIYVVSNKALGAGAAAATNLNLYICYRKTNFPAGSISLVGGGSLGIRVPANTRVPMGLSAFISVGPGDYDVGLCGSSSNAANWNSNEWSYTHAFVVQD